MTHDRFTMLWCCWHSRRGNRPWRNWVNCELLRMFIAAVRIRYLTRESVICFWCFHGDKGKAERIGWRVSSVVYAVIVLEVGAKSGVFICLWWVVGTRIIGDTRETEGICWRWRISGDAVLLKRSEGPLVQRLLVTSTRQKVLAEGWVASLVSMWRIRRVLVELEKWGSALCMFL